MNNERIFEHIFLGAYQPSNELMLRFYSYYKQATEGPCSNPKPAFWEVVKKAKWDAWTRLGNMSRTEAMNNYVDELKKVKQNSLTLLTVFFSFSLFFKREKMDFFGIYSEYVVLEFFTNTYITRTIGK